MNLPIAARNNAIVAVTSPDALDTRLAQAVSPPSVGGVSEPSTIKTLSGISFSTGKVLQGELMFGRTGSGKPMFWLRGQGKNYALLGVTNAMDAEIRAIKLIQGGGATQLRQTSEAPGSNVKSRPRERFEMPGHEGGGNLAVDLTSKDVNSKAGEGRSPGGFLGMTNPGEPRSKLTRVEKEAAEAFKGMGVPAEVTNANPRGHEKNAEMHAVVRLSNDAIGGSQYARATINKDPGTPQPDAALWKLPKGASEEFKRGYRDAKVEISNGHLLQATQQAGKGYIGGRAAGVQKVSVHARPNTTELVLPRRPTRQAPGAVSTATQAKRSQTSQPTQAQTQTPAPVSHKNADRITELFSDDTKMAEHFNARAFGKDPGNSPTSYLCGGHAVKGPFADVRCRVPDEYLLHSKRPLLMGREVLAAVVAGWKERSLTC